MPTGTQFLGCGLRLMIDSPLKEGGSALFVDQRISEKMRYFSVFARSQLFKFSYEYFIPGQSHQN